MQTAPLHPVDVVLSVGDITGVAADAIVNAANSGLVPGGGVCGAIMRAGGPSVAQECARIGGCAPGDAVATTAGALPARIVIHAVGPVWRGGDAGEDRLLASCHEAAVRVAADHGCRSIAVPAISTGIYGFPIHRAAPIALAAVARAAAPPLERIEFVLFSPGDRDVFAAALAARGG